MENIQNHIPALTDYAKAVIYKHTSQLNANEVISEMYIHFYDGKDNFTEPIARRFILNFILNNKRDSHIVTSIEDVYKIKEHNDTNVCKCCNEVLPIAAFRFDKRYGFNSNTCIICQRKKDNEYYKKNAEKISKRNYQYKKKKLNIQPKELLSKDELRLRHNERMKEVMRKRRIAQKNRPLKAVSLS